MVGPYPSLSEGVNSFAEMLIPATIRCIRLELLSHIAAGLGLMAWGALLVGRAARPKLYERLGWFVATLGTAMAARALYWEDHQSWHGHLMLAAFGLFPLPLGLFFEALLQRHLHLWGKLWLLAGTIFFVGTSWTKFALREEWWSLSLVAYHVITVAYLGALTARAFTRLPRGPRRSMYGATVVVCVVAVLLMATDWTFLLGLKNPKLGAVPALAVLYFGGASLDAGEEWRLRATAWRLVMYVAAAVALTILVALALGNLRFEKALVVGGVLLFSAVAFEPFRISLKRRRAQTGNVLLDRLSHLPARSIDEVLETLRGWPEIERIVYLQPEELQLASTSKVVAWMEGQGSVSTSSEVDRALALSASHQTLFLLEQVRHVMTNWKVEYLGLVGSDGRMLGVSFTVGLDAATYRRAFELIILVCRLVTARKAA